MAIYSGFTHEKWWFSIVMLVYQRVKQCHKPPMTGNDKHTTYKNGDDWEMVQMALLYPH